MPGGVNSPVRAFRAVGGTPIFFERGHGSRLVDADGNEYIDYVGGHGALLLGHSHPAVVAAVQEQVVQGTHWGSSHELEVRWAELVRRLVPFAAASAMARLTPASAWPRMIAPQDET